MRLLPFIGTPSTEGVGLRPPSEELPFLPSWNLGLVALGPGWR